MTCNKDVRRLLGRTWFAKAVGGGWGVGGGGGGGGGGGLGYSCQRTPLKL